MKTYVNVLEYSLPLDPDLEDTRYAALGALADNDLNAAASLIEITEENLQLAYPRHARGDTLQDVHHALVNRTWAHYTWRRALGESALEDALVDITDAENRLDEVKQQFSVYTHGNSLQAGNLVPTDALEMIKAERFKTIVMSMAVDASRDGIQEIAPDQLLHRAIVVGRVALCAGGPSDIENKLMIANLLDIEEIERH